ncbi:MAG: hypothetical protein JHC31_00480 [Sulfurihydrogenibium sp.]|nr:hypothetical protein [Sulfurihydrogenibium sp.]
MANINELKNKLLQEAQGQRKGLSFKKLAIDHANQTFVVKNNGEVVQSLGKEVEVLIIGEYGQYFMFDPRLERITFLSQITKPALIRQAIDLKSGKKVSEILEKLKQQGMKPVYTSILLVMVKNNDNWEEMLFYLKGAVLQSWIEIVKELQGYGVPYVASLLKLGLRSNKKGAVKYNTLTLQKYEECNNENLLAKAVLFLDKFKEEIRRYNTYEPSVEEIPIEPEETTLDDIVEY